MTDKVKSFDRLVRLIREGELSPSEFETLKSVLLGEMTRASETRAVHRNAVTPKLPRARIFPGVDNALAIALVFVLGLAGGYFTAGFNHKKQTTVGSKDATISVRHGLESTRQNETFYSGVHHERVLEDVRVKFWRGDYRSAAELSKRALIDFPRDPVVREYLRMSEKWLEKTSRAPASK